MKRLVFIVLIFATLVMLNAERIARGFSLSSHRIGLMYHECFRRCAKDPDLTVVNNTGRQFVIVVDHHKVVIKNHSYTEINL